MKLTIHTAHGKTFYRCGLRFGKEPVTIDTADLKLSKADVKRLIDEPMLVVEEPKEEEPKEEKGERQKAKGKRQKQRTE